MATIQYFIRTQTTGKLVNIRCRLRDGRNVDLSAPTGLNVYPEHWNKEKQAVKNITDATYKSAVNAGLKKLEVHLINEFTAGTHYDKDWLKNTIDKYNNPDKYKEKKHDLFSFIGDFIERAPTRINYKTNKPVSHTIIQDYERTFNWLRKYAEKKRKKIDFKDIDHDFYTGFVAYLKEQNYSVNTIGKYIKTLKVFLNAASDLGINHYKGYKNKSFVVIKEDSESIYLNENEITAIYEKEFTNKKYEKVKDLFIVGCWTGLRFSDWNKINKENISDGYLDVKQQKTGDQIAIPLHPTVEEIINKYDGVLPAIISNQKFNEFLKEIAEAAKINDKIKKTTTKGNFTTTKTHEKWELVTTHTARRSFATNLYLAGVPSLTIMAITGHKTESSFMKYIKVTSREHGKILREFWSRQQMKIAK